MQNIEEILKANGIEGDAATAIAKAVGENYKTVAEMEQKAKKLTETQAALDTANKALDEAKKRSARRPSPTASSRRPSPRRPTRCAKPTPTCPSPTS